MAPQVTVFFHKLPANAARLSRIGHRMTFVIGHAPVTCAKPKLEAKQDKLGMSSGKTQTFKAASKNSLRNRRKRAARAQRKRNAQANAMEAILAEMTRSKPAKEEVKTFLPSHIMVGSIQVNLPNVETVMVTSTKGGDEHEPRLPLQGSQSSTTSSQSTTTSQELDPKKLAEEISKALDAPTGPARPRGPRQKSTPFMKPIPTQGQLLATWLERGCSNHHQLVLRQKEGIPL